MATQVIQTVDTRPKCWRCKKMLGFSFTRPWFMFCPRCSARNGIN